MKLLDQIENSNAYILIGVVVLLIIVIIMTIIIMSKQIKLNKSYKKFMQGASGKDLEAILIEKFTDIDILKQESSHIHKEIDKINENILLAIQKVGVVKYDAFMEMGGKLSFALALLDKNNDGFILNSVHSSREGCYTYLKEIIKGESFVELSKEEKNALSQAIKSDNYME